MCSLPKQLQAALVASLAVAALAFAAPAQANPGDLDPTFGSGGILISDLDTAKGSSLEDLAIQPDGRTVVLERGYSQTSHLLRYLADGTLDPSFDGDGITLIPSAIGPGDIALQADGKILVSGFDLSGNFAVARFLSSGQIDLNFDGDSGTANGIIHVDLTPGTDLASSIAVDGQGRIVLAGHAGSTPSTSDVGIARLLPDGRLDKSFDGDGKLVYDTVAEVRVWDVAVQGDGKVIVAAGWGSYPNVDTMVQRFAENGLPDAFGPGPSGRKIFDVGGIDQATSVAVQPGGQVLVGSSSSGQDALLRLTSAGNVDTSFENGGQLPLTFQLQTIALAPDGKIVLGGWSSVDGLDAFAFQRRSADGAPDSTFAGGLLATHRAVQGEGSSSSATAVAPDGKIVSAGSTGYPGIRGALMRLNGKPDPPAPPVSPPVTTGPAGDALALSGLRITNRRFAVGRARTARVGQAQAAARRKRGTTFVFRLSHAASVSIRIKRRAKTAAVLKRTAHAGGNRIRFSGRVGRRALRPGRYRATLRAVDAAGKRSKPQTVRFRIVRG